jgi:hypothetical protein
VKQEHRRPSARLGDVQPNSIHLDVAMLNA